VALAGVRELMTGVGSGEVGSVIVNVSELDVAVELETVIVTVPGKAVSVAETVAVICVEFTNVVGRGEPFQFTTTPLAKSVPFTVSLRPVGLQ